MTDLFAALAAEFPRDAVHWRAQTLTANGDKALALAYLDARDVMDRLDEVCTPAGWRNSVTETPKGRVIATIEIKVGGEWIGKTDGAGDTDVEGEKGGISDSLKRAAVLWGIGRYLYRMPSVWAPCESYEKGGKRYWKAWRGSPWDCVRNAPPAPAAPNLISDADRIEIISLTQAAGVAIADILKREAIPSLDKLPAARVAGVKRKLNLTLDAKVEKKEAA